MEMISLVKHDMSEEEPVESLEAMLRRLRSMPPIEIPSLSFPLLEPSSKANTTLKSDEESSRTLGAYASPTANHEEWGQGTGEDVPKEVGIVAAASPSRRCRRTPTRASTPRRVTPTRIPVSCDPKFGKLCGTYFSLTDAARALPPGNLPDPATMHVPTPRRVTPGRSTPARGQRADTGRATTPRGPTASGRLASEEEELWRLQAEVRAMYAAALRREQDLRCRELAVTRREEEVARVERRLAEAERERRHWEHNHKVGFERTSRAREGVALRLKQHYEDGLERLRHREEELANESAALFESLAFEETRLQGIAHSLGVQPSIDLSSIHSREAELSTTPTSALRQWRR